MNGMLCWQAGADPKANSSSALFGWVISWPEQIVHLPFFAHSYPCRAWARYTSRSTCRPWRAQRMIR